MTAPFITVPGATIAITRRTVLRKGFLGPWDTQVKDVFLYAMARTQAKTDVDVHLSTLVINHHHTTVTPRSDNLPDFLRDLHRDTSKGLNNLLTKHRYDSPGGLFDGRGPHRMRLLDADAQASHLVYQRVNCVAAGLVEHPEDMPDDLFDFSIWKRQQLIVKRPDVFFDSEGADELVLRVTPPPLLLLQFGGDLDKLIYRMQALTEDAVKLLRKHRRGRKVLGVQRVTRLHPWGEPSSLRERGGDSVPTFRAGAHGFRGVELNVEACSEVRAFRHEYDRVRRARRDGDLTPVFPYGTYAQRVIHGAPVSDKPLGQLVTAPGILLEDVYKELGDRRVANAEQTTKLSEAVRDALADELAVIADEDHMDFERGRVTVRSSRELDVSSPSTTSAADDGTAVDDDVVDDDVVDDDADTDMPPPRAPVRHRRRYDKRDHNEPHAAREVVERDARRGRPFGKRADDPPA